MSVETVVHFRGERAGGKAINAIVRDLRLSRKVVRKAIDASKGAFGYHRSVQPLSRIGTFQERLDTRLTERGADAALCPALGGSTAPGIAPS